jgi:hypothetical protein
MLLFVTAKGFNVSGVACSSSSRMPSKHNVLLAVSPVRLVSHGCSLLYDTRIDLVALAIIIYNETGEDV